jgi:hypothetical protein
MLINESINTIGQSLGVFTAHTHYPALYEGLSVRVDGSPNQECIIIQHFGGVFELYGAILE